MESFHIEHDSHYLWNKDLHHNLPENDEKILNNLVEKIETHNVRK